jgi:hypothetical protein
VLPTIDVCEKRNQVMYHSIAMQVVIMFRYPSRPLVRAVHKQPLALDLLELLLTRFARTATEDQLSPQLPLEGNAPVLSGLLVNNGVVMLEVGAEALSLKSDPQSVLVHGICVLAPVAEVVCVEGECLAEGFNGFGGFVEQNL